MAFGLPIRLGILRGLLKELRTASGDTRPIAIGGATELAQVLRRELARGGDESAVRVGGPEDAAVYVHVLAGRVGEEDERALKRARRKRVPIVAVATGETPAKIPYVLATDVVPVGPGQPFPVEEIARVIAHRLGESGTSLAARLPALRGAVCDELIRIFARKNAIIGAAVFIPGADMPLLTLNQLRLVLRIAAAHGEHVGEQRIPEIAGVLGVGFGLRAIGRSLVGAIPVAGWAAQGALAYAGTKALGEAAVRYFASRQPAGGGDASATPRAAVGPGAP
jgi:uncharacterized protein (DUF697 family)